jgi:PiT family inorganic phosphate transporter
MGIITMLLLYYGFISEFTIPFWVIIASYIVLTMGVIFGGWRIVKTMATKVTRMQPYQGFSRDLSSSIILGSAALWGMPVSSTHAANGTLIGAGLIRGSKSVNWGTIRNMIWAWVLSAPLTAVVSYALYHVLRMMV